MAKYRVAVQESAYQIAFEERETPEIEDSQALVEVKACGICGSDVHSYANLHPMVTLPLVPGHEISGKVLRVGKEVRSFKRGDRVCVEPAESCGSCHYCKKGWRNLCLNLRFIGGNVQGAMGKYTVAEQKQLYKLPDSVSYAEGAMVEPLSVAVHAAKRCDLEAGDSVVVIGAGTIGLMALQVAKAIGASKVMICDVVSSRLALATKLKADLCINANQDNPVQAVLKKTEGLGADVVLDCAGGKDTLQSAIQMLRSHGRLGVISVYESRSIGIDPADILRKEINVLGVYLYCGDFRDALNLISSGKVRVKPLITSIMALEELEKGIKLMMNKDALKIIIRP